LCLGRVGLLLLHLLARVPFVVGVLDRFVVCRLEIIIYKGDYYLHKTMLIVGVLDRFGVCRMPRKYLFT
jgi:hypothetical protein